MINAYFFLALLSLLIASTSQVLLKMGAQREYSSFLREYLNPFVIGGYGLLMVSMVIAIVCYKGLGYLGTVVMEPISYIMVMILSRIIFKEKVTMPKIVGMVLIIAGIAVFYLLG
ncbi:MAG: multidrug ABC transporter [Butyrivibrio sp.]|uniref:multidrug ABC transporter n=1 Tax=Butyrivibrio sp. TaxID=28121 RepID=UPI001B49FF2C|nr:multidrug ABC transporter [Butyrivibrio sp.]MBP3784342.1 multidrug ABC transporter [Butyrivibrio sp.]